MVYQELKRDIAAGDFPETEVFVVEATGLYDISLFLKLSSPDQNAFASIGAVCISMGGTIRMGGQTSQNPQIYSEGSTHQPFSGSFPVLLEAGSTVKLSAMFHSSDVASLPAQASISFGIAVRPLA